MFSGDSLSVLLFFVGTALAGLMGAIVAPSGWRANVLWSIAVVSGVAALGWLVAPSASPAVQAIRPVLSAVVQSGALLMVGTVGIVALMIGGRRAQAPVPVLEEAPKFPTRSASDVINSLTNARLMAKQALTVGRDADFERALAGLVAAFLSAQKLFGTPTPPRRDRVVWNLEAAIRMADLVIPLLSEGHVDEAIRGANEFVSQLNPDPGQAPA
jgi:hypothetical protein